MARHHPVPTHTTRSPAAPAPTIWATLRHSRRQATAAGSTLAGTVCGVIACELGLPSAPSAPLATAIPASRGMLDQPPTRLAAANPCTRAAVALDPCIITVRGSRSPSTPPNMIATTSASA